MDRAGLDTLMRTALAKLEMVGLGGTWHYAAREPHSGGDLDGAPPGARDAPHEFFRRRYEGCRTDEQRREVVRAALRELGRIRRSSPPPPRVRPTDEAIGRDSRPVPVVADEAGISQSRVYQLRREYRNKAA